MDSPPTVTCSLEEFREEEEEMAPLVCKSTKQTGMDHLAGWGDIAKSSLEKRL